VPASSRQVLLFLTLSHYSLLMEVQSLPENVPLALAFRFSLVHLQHRRGTRDEDNKETGGFRLGSEAPRQPSRVWGQGVLFSLRERQDRLSRGHI